jgi:lipoprotein-releasing system ATP-binding protein
MSDEVIIRLINATKSFTVGKQTINVLKRINFEVNKGDFCVVIGPSGCGKSTLLHIMLGLEGPTSGVVEFLGTRLYENLVEDDRSEFRKLHIGMV